jgi:uncharacterized protein YndB with AHSA1/START domain
MTVSVNADRHRIFQVLTVAEYMETWLTLPGQSLDSHLAVHCDESSFRIDCRKQQQVDFSITGWIRTYRRSKLAFTWTKPGLTESGNSLVLIRLHGDFERTTLCLTHSGLGSGVERSWHYEMWKRSLDKLSSLF